MGAASTSQQQRQEGVTTAPHTPTHPRKHCRRPNKARQAIRPTLPTLSAHRHLQQRLLETVRPQRHGAAGAVAARPSPLKANDTPPRSNTLPPRPTQSATA